MKTMMLWLCGLSVCLAACRPVPEKPVEVKPKGGASHYKALRLFYDGGSLKESIALQEKAMEEMRRGEAAGLAVAILSQAGWFYSRDGQYVRGLECLQEATDSLRALPSDSLKVEQAVRLMQNQANLYARMGLYEDALRLNTEAIEMSEAQDCMLTPELWRMRATIYSCGENLDSALLCIGKSRALIGEMPESEYRTNLLAMVNYDQAVLFVEHYDRYPDSLDLAIAMLEKIQEKSLSLLYSLLGLGYIYRGEDARRGIGLMEKGLEIAREKQGDEDVEYALGCLAKAYVQVGDADKLAAIFPEYIAFHDTIAGRLRSNVLAGAEFKYRVREKEAELERLRREKEASRLIIAYQVVALILLLAVLVMVVTHFVRRNRRIVEKQERQKKRLTEVLASQQRLNATIEELNREIAMYEKQEVVTEVYRQLSPRLLDGESEVEFRKSFASLYPHFLPDLRRDYPLLTSGDELLCMLIYLNQSNKEIALSLGIAPLSVNTARHRLRKRFNLDKNANLEEFIHGRRG